MAQAYFPFTSLNDDRLYGSADFRMFFRTLLGNGRVTYDEIGITNPREGLLCTRDSIDARTVNISPGACFLNGAEYYTDETVLIPLELPTGSTVAYWYVIARIDPDVDRSIKLTAFNRANETLNPETDLVLGRIALNSAGIISANSFGPDGSSEILVAYTKYNLNKEQQDYIIEQLGKNQDLINYLATNTTLLNLLGNSTALTTILSNNTDLINRLSANAALHTALATNSDFMALVKGLNYGYTYLVTDQTSFSRWASNPTNPAYDFTRVLIKSNITWNGAAYSTGVVVNLTKGNTMLVDMEDGCLLTINTQSGTTTLVNDGYVITTDSNDPITRIVKNLNIRVVGQGRVFGFNIKVVDCKIAMYQNVSATALLNAFWNVTSSDNCKVVIEQRGGQIRIGTRTTINKLVVDGLESVSGGVNRIGGVLFDNCNGISYCTINYECDTTVISGLTIFNSCININNCNVTLSVLDPNLYVYVVSNGKNISNINCRITGGTIRCIHNSENISNVEVDLNGNNVSLLTNSNGISDVTARITNTMAAAETRPYVLSCTRLTNVILIASSNDPTSGNIQTGFASCDKISNCKLTIDGISTHRCGYYNCNRLTNCEFISTTAATLVYGLQKCNSVTGCDLIIENSAGSRGMTECNNLNANMITIVNTSDYNAYGLITCKRVNSCIINVTSRNSSAQGIFNTKYISDCDVRVSSDDGQSISSCYSTSSRLSNCLARLGAGAADTTIGFNDCVGLSLCGAVNTTTSVPASQIGFNGCYGLSRCGFTEADEIRSGWYPVIQRCYRYCAAGLNGAGTFPTGTDTANTASYGWNIGIVIG